MATAIGVSHGALALAKSAACGLEAAVGELRVRARADRSRGPYVESPHLFTYGEGEQWRGIDSIRDDTPGFEAVLAEGDMRLYKITAVEGWRLP